MAAGCCGGVQKQKLNNCGTELLYGCERLTGLLMQSSSIGLY